MQKLYAVLPNGQGVTRRTEREYKWVVAVKRDGIWQAWRWTASDKLARQVRREQERAGIYSDVQLVPVQLLSGSSRKHAGGGGSRKTYILSFAVSALEMAHSTDEEIKKIACHLGAERCIVDRELNAVTLFNGKGWRALWATIQQAQSFGWEQYQRKESS